MEKRDQARRMAPRTRNRLFLALSVALLAAGLTGCPGVQVSRNTDSTASSSAPAEQSAPAAVPAKPPSTGTATLSWQAPTENEDGTPIEGLAGYYIHFGSSAAELNELVEVTDASSTTYEITGLTSGTYYFAVGAYNVSGIEGPLSNIASKSF